MAYNSQLWKPDQRDGKVIMFFHETKLRVRYAETDQMRYVYYGVYANYFEVARVEALRNLGCSYKALEESGIHMPVTHYEIKYMRPAFYDEELSIKTTIASMPAARILFLYETFNAKNEQLNSARTELAFLAAQTGKPVRIPQLLHHALLPYF
jgi:acyl-CoA thioester hydrolase